MTEFWESSFQDRQTMWGFEPAESAIEVSGVFSRLGLKKVLIPGIGYGRNARVFIENGFDITGIEISKTAIGLARRHLGESIRIHQGSVSDMPFDQETYDGIFCYSLIHLLDTKERARLVRSCYDQLRSGGHMVFVAISKNTAAYGQGEAIDRDTFLTPHGVRIFYYDANSANAEFGNHGLLEVKEITEPTKQRVGMSAQKFWQITCRKAKKRLRRRESDLSSGGGLTNACS